MTAAVFPDKASYLRLTRRELDRWSRSRRFAFPERIGFAAMARANRDGHAEFCQGELAELLGSADRPVSGSTASNAIREAKELGYVGPESRVRCLVLNHDEADQGGGGYGCRTHRLPQTKWTRDSRFAVPDPK